MGKTRGDIKRELRETVKECNSFDEIITEITKYIINNFKQRKVSIDSDNILSNKKRGKGNAKRKSKR